MSFAAHVVSGRRASSSISSTSIEIGNAPTWTRPAVARPPPPRAVGLDAEQAVGQADEVLGRDRALEPDHVGARAGPSMTSSRHGSRMNSSCGRERDVQEEADAQVGPQRRAASPARAAGGSRAPTPWRRARPTSAARSANASLTRAVDRPAVGVVDRRPDRVVVQRPQRAVRDALVVAVDLLARRGAPASRSSPSW